MEDNNRLTSLDFIKGICVILVIMTHFPWSEEEKLRYLFPFWLSMAVPIFMVISGYAYKKSFVKHNIDVIGDAYTPKNVMNKLMRYVIPFFIAFFLEESYFFIRGKGHGLLEIVFSFLVGGYGPGGYYFPIMIQFIFVFPVIFFIIKKYDYRGLFICGFINVCYELLQCAYGMNKACYRLLVFRYILLIAFGCYLASEKYVTHKIMYLLCMFIGMTFIIAFCYLGYKPRIIIYWTKTSFLACLYVFPIAALLIRRLTFRCRIIELLGKASFHIYLTQMVYYSLAATFMYKMISNRMMQLIINIVVCVSVGIIFYYCDITKYIIDKYEKNSVILLNSLSLKGTEKKTSC